jgi:peptide/nickel transport system substrate-binding protein
MTEFQTFYEVVKDYWQNGADGKPLPYLDKIVYVGLDKDAGLAAIQADPVDSIFHPRPADYLALKDNPNVKVTSVDSSYAYLVRMRVDLPPWNDNRVRTALKMCQNRSKTLQLAGYGLGSLGIDAQWQRPIRHIVRNRSPSKIPKAPGN